MIRLFAFLALVFVGLAHAQVLDSYEWFYQGDGQWKKVPRSFPTSEPINLAQMGVSVNTQGKPMINGNSQWVPIPNKPGVKVATTIVPSAIAVKTVGRAFLRLYPPVAMGLAIYQELNSHGVTYVPDGNDGECTEADEQTKACGWRKSEETQYQLWGDPPNGVPYQFPSGQAVCDKRRENLSWPSPLVFHASSADSGFCKTPSGSTMGAPNVGDSGSSVQTRRAEDADLEAAIAASPNVQQANLLWEALRSGQPLPLDGTEQMSAVLEKNSVEEESGLIDEKTVQNSDGTSTTTKRYNTTQETGQVTGSTVSTVRIESHKETVVKEVTTNNSTTSPNPQQPDPTFTDPTMPGIPDLYEQKYENGLIGVWNQRWPELQATAFIQGIQNMFPQMGNGGSCPDWGMTFNIGANMNYGSHSFGVPCSLWGVLSLIILTTACFSAWRIIFG